MRDGAFVLCEHPVHFGATRGVAPQNRIHRLAGRQILDELPLSPDP
jgi:hypothetical protein